MQAAPGFRTFAFTKPAEEIVERAKVKVAAISAKIEERQKRVNDLRREYDIDDAALIELYRKARKNEDQMSYSLSNAPVGASGAAQAADRIIGAGVVMNLLTESDAIEAEKEQVKTLELIARNLKPLARFASDGTPIPPAEFTLTYDELSYFGF